MEANKKEIILRSIFADSKCCWPGLSYGRGLDQGTLLLGPFWGGIEIPPQIPPHEIPLIDTGLVSMGGMGGSF